MKFNFRKILTDVSFIESFCFFQPFLVFLAICVYCSYLKDESFFLNSMLVVLTISVICIPALQSLIPLNDNWRKVIALSMLLLGNICIIFLFRFRNVVFVENAVFFENYNRIYEILNYQKSFVVICDSKETYKKIKEKYKKIKEKDKKIKEKDKKLDFNFVEFKNLSKEFQRRIKHKERLSGFYYRLITLKIV